MTELQAAGVLLTEQVYSVPQDTGIRAMTHLLQVVFHPAVGAFLGAITAYTIYIIKTKPFNPNNVLFAEH